MTPNQIDNFRRVLVSTLGPMALTFSDQRIEEERDACQRVIDIGQGSGDNLESVGLKQRPPTEADRIRGMQARRSLTRKHP